MTAGNRCCVCPGGDAVALSLQPLCEKKNRACIVVVCDKKNSLDPIYSAETIHIYININFMNVQIGAMVQ